MSAVQPSGPFSVPLHVVRGWLDGNAAWEAWAGGVQEAAAQLHLITAPANAPHPHIIVDFDTGLARRRDGQTVGPFSQAGGLVLYFCDRAGQRSDVDAQTEFLNRVGAVMAELELLPPLGGAPLVLNGWDLAGGPSRISKQERDKRGDELEVLLSLDLTAHPS